MTARRVPAEQDRTVSSVKTKDQTPIIAAHGVSKEFLASDGNPFLALDDVSIEVGEGEIVALLGTSGSGKSTLLRLLAGLLDPTHGHVTYRGGPVDGPNPGVSMVFQSFALLPWLTVQQNVELGLEAQGVPPAERHDRALAAIDLIGLDGFEQAYPKELSGGMRQRVGFARSVVMEPDVLLMDEPFSALDVLTAENLRGELLRLWDDHKFPTKALLLVTHNIEEAVLLADRVVILSSGPGRVKGAFPIPLPCPRDRRAPDFIKITDTIYELLTQKEGTQKESSTDVFVDTVGVGEDTTPSHLTLPAPSLADSPLPKASVDGIGGLLDILVPRGGATTSRNWPPSSPPGRCTVATAGCGRAPGTGHDRRRRRVPDPGWQSTGCCQHSGCQEALRHRRVGTCAVGADHPQLTGGHGSRPPVGTLLP